MSMPFRAMIAAGIILATLLTDLSTEGVDNSLAQVESEGVTVQRLAESMDGVALCKVGNNIHS